MLDLLWVIPAAPLLGFVALALLGPRLPARASAAIGVASVGVAAAASLGVSASFLQLPVEARHYTQVLWTWIDVAGLSPRIALYLDAVSLVMTVVVTFVSFFIHVYSAGFMAGDEGYSRFFAYMNLFVASMITLLLADNLLLLYLGWEGVGLCSYLLIGFWYQDPANGLAARKAFIVTRVGDTAMALGLFLLFSRLGTLDIQELMRRASEWPVGAGVAVAASLLLLGGALGKSAQLPLHTWLPDAMAGPTPTSALIHAATMVTAGVYLIARTHALFALAPAAQWLVGVIGAVTLLAAGCSALAQTDIKRVLAYSTISQIGYMFLALGVGAWSAALFHFVTHAFFKALLFLAAGIVIEALHHEHDIFRMGGLRRSLPIAFWTFLAGGCALAGLPLVTAGFYSKDLILYSAWASSVGGVGFWVAGMIGVALTSLYTFRVVFLVFFGEERTAVSRRPGRTMVVPAVVLAVFAVGAGWINLPPWLGGREPLSGFLSSALPALPGGESGAPMSEAASSGVAVLAFLAGLAPAYLLYLRRRGPVLTGAADAIRRLSFADWGLDWLYDRVFVRPVVWLARAGRNDVVDAAVRGLAGLASAGHRALSRSENGVLRWYAAGLAAGTIVFLGVVLFL